MLSQWVTVRIRDVDAKICSHLCVQQLLETLCSLYLWPTFFGWPEAIGRFQVMCISVCQCVTPPLSFRLGWFQTALWIIAVITWEECNSFCHVHRFDLWSVTGTNTHISAHSSITINGLVKGSVLDLLRQGGSCNKMFVSFFSDSWSCSTIHLKAKEASPDKERWKRRLRNENKAERRTCWHTKWRYCSKLESPSLSLMWVRGRRVC